MSKNKKTILLGLVALIFLLVIGQVLGMNQKVFNILKPGNKTQESASKPNITKTETMINASPTELKYQKTVKRSGKRFDVYSDVKGNSYTFTSDKVTGFLRNRKIEGPVDKNNKITDKKIIDMTKELGLKILSQFGRNLDDYRVDKVRYTESYGEYGVTFTKYIGNYMSNDSFSASFNNNGELESFSARDIGLYDKVYAGKIDIAEVNKYVKQEISKKYPNAKIEIDSQYLNYIDGKIYMQSNVGIDDDGINKSEQILYLVP
ncbi:hypothetical protein CR956_00820 [Candidatus Saccharibacteria bacterium]|nr:MAG: hypothetical protein CR956_00820 [Candidatus Saccharibacteria bacterium]